MNDSKDFRYFSSVEGQVVQRYGSPVFIGAERSGDGWTWNTAAVVAIPKTDIRAFGKEYFSALRNGSLIEKTEADYQSYLESQQDPIESLEPTDTYEPADKKPSDKHGKKPKKKSSKSEGVAQ